MDAIDRTPAVTILIPTYNQEALIGRAIVSALAQDYSRLEVIVVDDASTDATPSVVQAWDDDSRFRYVRNPHNLGRVDNYHHALYDLAKGDWVLMLDGDDFLTDSRFISKALAAIAGHRGRPIVFAQAGQRIHSTAGQQPDVDALPPIDGDHRVVSGGDYLRLLFQTGFFSHLGTLYNRQAAMRVGFYTAQISSTDMDSLLRLALEGETLLLRSIAGCWVQHGANASSRVAMGEIAANVRIFRQAAGEAVRRGLARWQELDAPLRRYEADTATYLFATATGRSGRGLLIFPRLLAIAWQINPRLLADSFFLSRCVSVLWISIRAVIDQSLRNRGGRVSPSK
jgi:glycosyltransferase involved in cell wall biosynthesis